MIVDTVAVLILSFCLLALGSGLVREWRVIAAWASERVNPALLFGPAGERVLPITGVLAIFGGMTGIASVVLKLIA